MKSQKNGRKTAVRWLLVALLATLIAAPNGLVVKMTFGDISPFLVNFLRFIIVTLIAAPAIWRNRQLLTRKQIAGPIYAGIYITVAATTFVTAIKLSQASYVNIITLITPVILLIYSVKLYKERLERRAITGITLAAIGALLLVVLPFAQQGSIAFYPMATFLTLLNCFIYPLAIIQTKKANEAGMPMIVIVGISSAVVAVLSFLMLAFSDTPTRLPTSHEWLGVLFSGIGVVFISQMLKVLSYEHVGVAVTSTMMYLETFLGILLPVFILREHISVITVVGGIFVLLGVYAVESHTLLAHKHHHYWRSH